MIDLHAHTYMSDGQLGPAALSRVYDTLRRLPLLISRDDLRARLLAPLDGGAAPTAADVDALLAGWREQALRRGLPDGRCSAAGGAHSGGIS